MPSLYGNIADQQVINNNKLLLAAILPSTTKLMLFVDGNIIHYFFQLLEIPLY